MANRYYAPELTSAEGEFLLVGSEAHHLATVCRAKVQEPVILFNGQGLSATGRILEISKKQVLISLDKAVLSPSPVDRTLGVAFPKGDRALILVEKCVELGVARLVPLITERTVTQPGEGKRDRLERAVIEACKQSGRDYLMRIDPPTKLADVLQEGEGWMLDLSGDWISAQSSPMASRIIVGPEGGWSDAERAAADNLGWKRVRVARGILRVETAAIALAAQAAWMDTMNKS
ncbi:16S rRNA (uracil(1498)-N(3))-methyltransferase [bacterium]|nr:16S rRNA (uracil(1498)-N(3))-methyltransferase [bacterium]